MTLLPRGMDEIEPIRREMRKHFPDWAQVVSLYRKHKPYDLSTRKVTVVKAVTNGVLLCRRCKRQTHVLQGETVWETCAYCIPKCSDTEWLVRPATTLEVVLLGSKGGRQSRDSLARAWSSSPGKPTVPPPCSRANPSRTRAASVCPATS